MIILRYFTLLLIVLSAASPGASAQLADRNNAGVDSIAISFFGAVTNRCDGHGLSVPLLVVRQTFLPAFPTAASGLTIHEFVTTEQIPVLGHIFFDSGSAEIPARYHRYQRPDDRTAFSEEKIPSGGVEAHASILDVIGSRLQRFPATKVEVIGTSSFQPDLGETKEISTARGLAVYRYLTEIWKIDTARVRLLPARGWPDDRSSRKDPLWEIEKRRAEIRSDDWEILRPVMTRGRDSTVVITTLIQFKFDSPDPGPLNERIIRELVVPLITPGSRIQVSGHTDIVGMEDRNMKLSRDRAEAVATRITRLLKPGMQVAITHTGMGETVALYDNMLPEGRTLGRCVRVTIIRPE